MKDEYFDRSKCCNFFGKWYKAIKTIVDRTENGKEFGWDMVDAILKYSLEETEPVFEGKFSVMLDAMWQMIVPDIEVSIENREKNWQSESRDKEKAIIIEKLVQNPNSHYQEIADLCTADIGKKISKDKVGRTFRENEAVIMERRRQEKLSKKTIIDALDEDTGKETIDTQGIVIPPTQEGLKEEDFETFDSGILEEKIKSQISSEAEKRRFAEFVSMKKMYTPYGEDREQQIKDYLKECWGKYIEKGVIQI